MAVLKLLVDILHACGKNVTQEMSKTKCSRLKPANPEMSKLTTTVKKTVTSPSELRLS